MGELALFSVLLVFSCVVCYVMILYEMCFCFCFLFLEFSLVETKTAEQLLDLAGSRESSIFPMYLV